MSPKKPDRTSARTDRGTKSSTTDAKIDEIEAKSDRRMHADLVTYLRKQASAAGLPWDAVLDRADLPKASRSRVNSGEAGLPTIAKVRDALEVLAQELGPIKSFSVSLVSGTTVNIETRWVVVESRQGLFFGRTDATDAEIAQHGHVRLYDCRSIRGEVSPSTLAAIGPRDPQQVGLAAPSALVLGVLNVYDCTPNAVKAFPVLP